MIKQIFNGFLWLSGCILFGCNTVSPLTYVAEVSHSEVKSTKQLINYKYTNLPQDRISDKFKVSVEDQSLVLLQTTPPSPDMSPKRQSKAKDGADSYRKQNRSFAWGQFSFDASQGPLRTHIQKQDPDSGEVSNIIIRPTQLENVAYKIISKDLSKRSVTIDILQPNRKLSVEFVDNRYATEKALPLDALLIFADQHESQDFVKVPDKFAADTYVVKPDVPFDLAQAQKARVVYFAAGTHNIGLWWVPEKVRHVYLEGGAYVMGAINSDHEGKDGQSGFVLSGRGVISGENFPWRASTQTQGKTVCVDEQGYSQGCPGLGVKPVDVDQNDFIIEGVTLVNIPFYAFSVRPESSFSRDEVKGKVRNVKLLGMWRYNNDGFDLPSNVELSDCFVAAMDDAFKVYHDNVSVKNSVVWQMDNGGIFQFGWFPKSVENAIIENIHVIHTEWTGLNKNRGLANMTERPTGSQRPGLIQNIQFKNIYMEGPVSRVFYLRNQFYPNQSYQNWYFENIHIDYIPSFEDLQNIKTRYGGNGDLNPNVNLNAIENFSDTAFIKNIRFKDIYINKQKITELNKEKVGKFTLNLKPGDSVVFE